MNISEQIKFHREKKNIKKSELARLIGVSPTYIKKLESGVKVNPSISILMKLSKVLDAEIGEFDRSILIVKELKDYSNAELLNEIGRRLGV